MSKSKKELPPINGAHYTGIFDSHCHYDDSSFLEDQDALIAAVHENGVSHFINIGCDLRSIETSQALAAKYPYFYCAVGIHPEAASQTLAENPDYIELIRNACRNNPKVVAIGEIGLDYHYDDNSPREVQKVVFEQQLQLAKELNIPVVIHSREAVADTLELLKKYQPQGVVHCFSGAPEVAREILKLGMYIGYTGVLTFNNAKKIVDSAAVTPDDRFLLETDCPYMAPAPFRGKRCQSDMIAHTAERMAQIKELPVQTVIDMARENTMRLFHIAP